MKIEYHIVALLTSGEILPLRTMMKKAFGDDLELAAEWIEEIHQALCPAEFVIATEEVL